MKIGEPIQLVDTDTKTINGIVTKITIEVIDEDGEIWEIPIEEALVPEFEKI